MSHAGLTLVARGCPYLQRYHSDVLHGADMQANTTRVGWFSHKSGVSNAHLLPEVLVNTDTHLDLFDSESEDASDFEELIEVQANG